MKTTLKELAAFAEELRTGDWTAPFSDSHHVWARFDTWKDAMKARGEAGDDNMKRIWELAYKFEAAFTWWEDKDRPDWEQRTAERFEDGWRWAGAYLWVHGVKVTEEEAKALVGAPSSRHPKYNHMHMTGRPDWEKIFKMIEEK